MGYYIDQVESNFYIKAENIPAAWKALKEMFCPNNGTHHNGHEHWYSWIDSREVLESSTFEDAMSSARWDVLSDKNGNIVNILFNGEKYGDEELILGRIAPFVEDGSYIVMQGEEGERWKWKFVAGALSEVRGRFVFDDEIERYVEDKYMKTKTKETTISVTNLFYSRI